MKDGTSFKSARIWSECFQYAASYRAHFRFFGIEGGKGLETEDPLNGIGVLRACNAFESYCRVYDPRPDTRLVLTFLLLNSHLPNSVSFNVNQLAQVLEQVTTATETRRAGELNRTAGKLQAHLQYGQIEDVIQVGPLTFLAEIMHACDQVHEALYDAYINYSPEEAFS